MTLTLLWSSTDQSRSLTNHRMQARLKTAQRRSQVQRPVEFVPWTLLPCFRRPSLSSMKARLGWTHQLRTPWSDPSSSRTTTLQTLTRTTSRCANERLWEGRCGTRMAVQWWSARGLETLKSTTWKANAQQHGTGTLESSSRTNWSFLAAIVTTCLSMTLTSSIWRMRSRKCSKRCDEASACMCAMI